MYTWFRNLFPYQDNITCFCTTRSWRLISRPTFPPALALSKTQTGANSRNGTGRNGTDWNGTAHKEKGCAQTHKKVATCRVRINGRQCATVTGDASGGGGRPNCRNGESTAGSKFAAGRGAITRSRIGHRNIRHNNNELRITVACM